VRGDVVFDPQLCTCLLDEPFDPRARDLRLSAEQQADVVEYLKSL